MHRGIATFTLDTGKCPPWLFQRMVKLGREMMYILISEYGPDEFIKRLGDPVWFQTLGTVLAFDWNASGLTTILTAALKEAIRGQEKDFGIAICGGKGKTSLKTPEQIVKLSEKLYLSEFKAKKLVYNSKMSAKVDSSLLQDNYELYHHAFFFSINGAWTVVQQGMNKKNKTARRYHWHDILPPPVSRGRLGGGLNQEQNSSNKPKDIIKEPHSGIMSQLIDRRNRTLNMTATDSDKNRVMSVDLVHSSYHLIMKDIQLLRRHFSEFSKMISVETSRGTSLPHEQLTLLELPDMEFKYHPVIHEDFSKSKYLEKILWKLNDEKPQSYEQLLATPGVGPKTIRALSLVSEVIYGAPASYTDPARYSFAHGGKDATPYPVDRQTYDQSITVLKKAIHKMSFGISEKQKALERLEIKSRPG